MWVAPQLIVQVSCRKDRDAGGQIFIRLGDRGFAANRSCLRSAGAAVQGAVEKLPGIAGGVDLGPGSHGPRQGIAQRWSSAGQNDIATRALQIAFGQGRRLDAVAQDGQALRQIFRRQLASQGQGIVADFGA